MIDGSKVDEDEQSSDSDPVMISAYNLSRLPRNPLSRALSMTPTVTSEDLIMEGIGTLCRSQ